MTRDLTINDLAADVDHLTRPMRVTREEADGVTRPITLPSLIDQLTDCLTPSSGTGGGRSAYRGAPPLRTDVIDALLDIERAVDHWTVNLRLETRGSLSGDLRQMVGAATRLTPATIGDLAADVRRLLTIARTATEWETAPYRPNGSCPICGQRGTLRVRIEARTAYCTRCGQHWTPDTLDDLGTAVRKRNGEA